MSFSIYCCRKIYFVKNIAKVFCLLRFTFSADANDWCEFESSKMHNFSKGKVLQIWISWRGSTTAFNEDDVHFMSHASGTFVLQLERRVLRYEVVCMSDSIVSFSFIRNSFLVFITYLNLHRSVHTFTWFTNTYDHICTYLIFAWKVGLLWKWIFPLRLAVLKEPFSFSLTLRLSAYIVSLLRGTWQRTVNWNNRLRHSCCRS